MKHSNCLLVVNHDFVVQQELLAEVDGRMDRHRHARDEFIQIPQQKVFALRLLVETERVEDKAHFEMVLECLYLAFILPWMDLIKTFRHSSFTKQQNSLILDQASKRHFDQTLIASHPQYEVVVVKLSLGLEIGFLVE